MRIYTFHHTLYPAIVSGFTPVILSRASSSTAARLEFYPKNFDEWTYRGSDRVSRFRSAR